MSTGPSLPPPSGAGSAPASLRGYPTMIRRVCVADREYALLGPANYDHLTDDPAVAARFERDEYMPYWADLWPGALMLADFIAAWPPVPAGMAPPTALELGCGLGLVGLVAAARGWRVIASDYDADAIAFAEYNAALNGLPAPMARLFDWRRTYDDIRVDCILAADVLYETRNLVPIADFLREHLRGGTPACGKTVTSSLAGRADGVDVSSSFALVADPDRSTADAFDSIARHSGLSVEISRVPASNLPGRPRSGRIFKLRRKPA